MITLLKMTGIFGLVVILIAALIILKVLQKHRDGGKDKDLERTTGYLAKGERDPRDATDYYIEWQQEIRKTYGKEN